MWEGKNVGLGPCCPVGSRVKDPVEGLGAKLTTLFVKICYFEPILKPINVYDLMMTIIIVIITLEAEKW